VASEQTTHAQSLTSSDQQQELGQRVHKEIDLERVTVVQLDNTDMNEYQLFEVLQVESQYTSSNKYKYAL
jgi:hypothetical protein